LRITCDYCLTEYQVQPPPAQSEDSASRFSFRCSNCGRVFSADHPEPAEVSETPPEEPVATALEKETPKDILIRQGDETYSANDIATVQRWIVERRLNREGLISMDGQSWKVMGDFAELLPFLELVEKVQSLEHPVQKTEEPAPPAVPESVFQTEFVEVGELESAILLEPENTQDELDSDPFPTEEVPLPPTPIATNLKHFSTAFTAPNTEEVPFDFPLSDDQTLEAPKIDLAPEPSLPSLSHAQDMVDAPGPTFADDQPDFPTEEELLVLEEEPENDPDPLGNQLFASVESDWDDGIEDEDLAWVSDKKHSRRIVLGLLLLTLSALTGKLLMNRKASSPSTTTTANVPPQDEAKAMTQADPPANEISKPEEETLKEETLKKEKPKAEKPKAEKPVAKRPSPEKNVAKDPGAQARRAKAAKEAAVKRGPQPKTAADFVDRGRQAIVLGDYVAARIHYLDAVGMEPNNAAANQGLAFAALKQGDESFAVTHFCKALSLSNPTSSMAKEAHKNLAKLNEKCP
jgi:hypothetical protein